MSTDDVRAEVVGQFRQKWSRTRLKGRRRFAAIYGGVIWGGLSALGTVLGQIFKWGFDIRIGTATIVFFAVGGYLVGLRIWDANEK